MAIVSIILDVLFSIVVVLIVVLIMIMCVKDLIDTHRWNKKMEVNHAKIMSDVTITEENYKLKMAIQDANLNIYETPSGKYILIPKEDK